MTRITCISLLALSLLAAADVAGAEEPGMLTVEDATLDPMPPAASAYADLVRAQLELVDGETLRATIELAALPEVQPGVAYVLVFRAGSADHYLAVASAPATAFYHGAWAGQGPGQMEETSGSYEVGAPGIMTIDMPASWLPDATVLTQPRAYAVDIKGGAAPLPVGSPIEFLVLDEAEGEGELVLREPAPSTAGEPAPEPTTDAPDGATVDAAPAGAAHPSESEQDKAVPAPAVLLVIAALGIVARARR